MGNLPILYLGDTSLDGNASYLAGVLTAKRLSYDYLPSDVPVNGEAREARRLYIFSDYRAEKISAARQREIIKHVHDGAGIIMIGGWESFHGDGGNWDNTPLSEILPVKIDSRDDRVNCDQPAMARKVIDHPILEGLPWDTRPPTIGGFNKFTAKAGAQALLNIERYRVTHNGDAAMHFETEDSHPLLVVGEYGKGRTAAFATDLAPHWCGGLVDWSTGGRLIATAPGAHEIEVGDCYAQFIANLMRWTGKL